MDAEAYDRWLTNPTEAAECSECGHANLEPGVSRLCRRCRDQRRLEARGED
jgi:Zn ribbon nucleic-acid-binding protein